MLDRPPETQGWSTTDEHEIEIRRWRGRTEIGAVEPLAPREPEVWRRPLRSRGDGLP